jgi:eukaryotic-like serine/threonine-protein kinase
MTPERWHRITHLFHAAMAREEATRDAFLEAECRDDPDLRGEVAALLAATEDAGSFGKTGIFGLSRLASDITSADPRDVIGRLPPGTLLADRFTLVRRLGAGGMGTVYEAIDQKLTRVVALKCARPGYGHRLPPEARAAREVSHFNVCKVHDLHVVSIGGEEIDVLSMEFVEGETLAQAIARDGPLAPGDAREIALQIADGLAQAHRQQVVHGDLKCENVIMGRSAQGDVRAVITDFGLASLKFEADSGERGGTRAYMAPELFDGGRATVASDVYAFGVMLHTMLAGKPPRRDDPRARELPALAPLPSPWKRIVGRCLQPDPANRPATVDQVVRPLMPRRWWWTSAAAILGITAILIATLQSRRAESLGPPVRLAVLPLAAQAVNGGSAQAADAGIGANVAARLTGLRRNFTVIAPDEAKTNRVDTPDKGRRTLGATHVLETRVQSQGADIAVEATLVDLQSGQSLRQLSSTYPASDPQLVTAALVGMVTEAFRLPPGDADRLLTGPDGVAYAEGMELLRESSANGAKAIPCFVKAIALNPRSPLPYAGLAEAQLQLFERERGEWLEAASASVRTAKSLNAAPAPVLLASGSLAQQYGRYEDAVRDFTRVTELEPTNSEAWRRLANVYESTNPDAVVSTYEKAIQAQPGYYRHYLSLGNFYFNHSQYDRAEALARKVIDVAPGLTAGHTNLGLALMRQGRYREAEASLQTSLRINENAFVLANIGVCHYAQERFEEALHYHARALAVGPPTPTRFSNLGDAYRHLGRADEAAGAYRKALDLAEAEVVRDPRSGLSRVLLGMIAAQLGDRRRADAEISQSLALEPDNATVMRQAAIGYEALGERERTLAVLSRAPVRTLEELSHQPDVKDLQQDRRFKDLLEQKRVR